MIRQWYHLAAVAAFLGLWCVFLWQFQVTAPAAIDEVQYALSAQRWSEHRDFQVPNGFQHYRSDLLMFFHFWSERQSGGVLPLQEELTTYIPPLYVFFASPFYRLGGAAGLFLLNTISYCVCGLLFAWMAARLSSAGSPEGGNPRVCWIAAGIWVFSTYFADYAISVMNHMITLVFVLGAVAAHPIWLRTVDDPDRSRRAVRIALVLAFISGLLAGIAVGIRLQVIVTAAVLAVFALINEQEGTKRFIAFMGGFYPPLIVIAVMNGERFGIPGVFTTGRLPREPESLVQQITYWSSEPALCLAAALTGTAIIAAAAGWLRWRWRDMDAARKDKWTRAVLPACGVAAVVICVLPPFNARFLERILGAHPFAPLDPAWQPIGPVAFWAGVRNALSQSFPLSPALLVLPFAYFRAYEEPDAGPDRKPKLPLVMMLGAVLWANVLFVCFLASNGGWMTNQRYLIDGLAVGLILLPAMGAQFLSASDRPWLFAGAGLLILHLILVGVGFASERGEWLAFALDRILPVFFALLLALGFSIRLLVRRRGGTEGPPSEIALGVSRLVPLMVPLALGLPLVNHLAFDMIGYAASGETRFNWYATRAARLDRKAEIDALRPQIPDGTLWIVYGLERESAGWLRLEKDIWIGDVLRSDWETVLDCIEFMDERGLRDHFIVTLRSMPPEVVRELNARYEGEPLSAPSMRFVRLIPRDG